MICPLCKGQMLPGKSNLPFSFDAGQVVVIVNVPALVCEQCGDDFIQIDVVRKVEIILEKVKRDGLAMGFVEYERAA